MHDRKIKDDKSDKILQGELFIKFYEDCKVACFAWKDNALVLIIANCTDGSGVEWTQRKRPLTTSTSAKSALKFFGDQARKLVTVPIFNRLYNLHISAVDNGDQLKYYNPKDRRLRRGPFQALFCFLFDTVLVNCFLLSYHQQLPCLQRFCSQVDFRKQLYKQLFVIGGIQRTQGRPVEMQNHSQVHRGRESRGRCRYCQRNEKRSPLGKVSGNARVRKTSVYSCKQCKAPLCHNKRQITRCQDLYYTTTQLLLIYINLFECHEKLRVFRRI